MPDRRMRPGRVPPIKRLGIPDAFAHKYGSQDDLMEIYGLQPPQIVAKVRERTEGAGDCLIHRFKPKRRHYARS